MDSNSSSQPTRAKRRILIVDDHPVMRRGLTDLIDNEPDLAVCAAAATCRAGLEAFAASRPDLVITDLSLAEADGLGLVRELCSSDRELPVLVLTLHDAPRCVQRALRAGARGYVTKQDTTETLVLAIRCVLNGETYVSPKIGVGRYTT